MARLDISKAGELRAIAERFRRRAAEMTLLNYIDLMQRTAEQLEAEASDLERCEPVRPGRHLDIVV